MAEYFLAKSPTYMKSTQVHIITRQRAIAKRMKTNYKITKNQDQAVFRELVKELKAQETALTMGIYRRDKETMRYAFLWLSAESDKDRESIVIRAGTTYGKGIAALKTDGIKTWAQLGYEYVEPKYGEQPNGKILKAPHSVPLANSIGKMAEEMADEFVKVFVEATLRKLQAATSTK